MPIRESLPALTRQQEQDLTVARQWLPELRSTQSTFFTVADHVYLVVIILLLVNLTSALALSKDRTSPTWPAKLAAIMAAASVVLQ
jgi:hypothetical protein